jgi:hypothetical protein
MKQLWLVFVCVGLGGCMSAAKHSKQLGTSQDRALTLGVVQKQIKVGMSQPDVATALGSPNIVTGDLQNHETWIYDKIASEASFSQDSGGASASVFGDGRFPGSLVSDSGSVNGNVSGYYGKSAGAASITQRTLTVVIKFSSTNTVESVSYNSTRF